MGLFSKKVSARYPEWFASCPEDKGVLQSHFEAGSDFTKPFNVDAFLYFPTQGVAERVGDKLRSNGSWTVSVRKLPEGQDWTVAANNENYMLDFEGVTKLRALFGGLAEAFAGEYDGWGAEVNTAKRS